MICKRRRFGYARTIASTRSRALAIAVAVLGFVAPPAFPQSIDPEVGRLLEGALQQAETLRKQLPNVEYEAKMRVQEWDGRGRLRGTAKAHAIMRPGDTRPVEFISREIEGKVRLPSDKEDRDDDSDEKKVTLQEFAREHHIPERYEVTDAGTDSISGKLARRITFKPRPNQPRKNTADRFLDTIAGTAWIAETDCKLVKFEMRLLRPFQLLWIFAVLKELSIEYELLAPGEIVGHAKLKVLFSLNTPVYSIRQLHDVDLSNFRRRDATAAVNVKQD